MINTTVNTKIVGLFGNPLGHSLSPIMQNTAFSLCGIEYIYIPFQVEPGYLEKAIKAMMIFNFAGANITIPYKTEVIKYIDEIDEMAKAIGAVNTLVVKNKKIIGYNTDGMGFTQSLKNKGFNPKGKIFLLIGAGGAARGLAFTLAFEGAAHIFIANRTFEKADILAQDVNRVLGSCATALSLEEAVLRDAAKKSQVLINTTSIGMYPDTEYMPISDEVLRPELLVCDIVYNPVKTKLLQTAESIGCPILEGYGMLVNQGAEAFRLWTGKEPPIDAMTRVVLDKLTI
jgi:shikimate dehydrogenase